jgi:hypothetical protein
VAACVAMTSRGEIFCVKLVDKAFNAASFIEFLEELNEVAKQKKVMQVRLLLDNLPLHRTRAVKQRCCELGIE